MNELKIAFCTLGCKVNQYETDLLKEQAENLGYTIVDFEDMADVYCVNTCSVTNKSDRKTSQMISKAKNKHKNAIVAVIGCNVDSIKDKSKFNEYKAEIIIGNRDKLDLFEEIEKHIISKNKVLKLRDINEQKEYSEKYILKKGYDIREAIKIQDGCNNFCSYCIIPYLRGRIRSKEKEIVLNEVTNLAKNGVKEIVLVGIEVTSYGKDLENTNLIDLMEEINKIEGVERIRLSSLDPRFLTEENIIKLSKISKLCNHFHISMQSLDNDVLKGMNRKYKVEDVEETVKNLRKYFYDPFIATDIIVGFPGETDEMFLNTKNNLERLEITEIHVFKYSKREYTKAANMEGQVLGDIKKERSNKILLLSRQNKEKYLSKYIGKKLEVLFENYTNGINTGLTKNYIKVKMRGNNICGTTQDVVGISLEKGEIIKAQELL